MTETEFSRPAPYAQPSMIPRLIKPSPPPAIPYEPLQPAQIKPVIRERRPSDNKVALLG